ncbi:MAG: thioredoxin [Polyangiaceae bacterium]
MAFFRGFGIALVACAAAHVGGCKTSPDTAGTASAHTSPPTSGGATTASNAAIAGKVRLLDGAPEGDLAASVAKVAAASRADGRSVVVYVGAKWCEPCRHFHDAAAAGKLDAAFPKLDVLQFDRDRDGARLDAAGYESAMIPLFVVPGADGRATDKRIEGSIKGPGAVDNIAPRLHAILD